MKRVAIIGAGGLQAYSMYKPGQEMAFIAFKEPPEGYHETQYLTVADVINALGSKYIKDFLPIEVDVND